MQSEIWEAIRANPGGNNRNFQFLTQSLLTKLLACHDFGSWSHTSLDGIAGGSSIVTNLTDNTLTVSQVYATLGAERGKNDFGVLPVMLKLESEDDKLKYNIKLERIECDQHDLHPLKLWKQLYLLAHGELRRDWVWGYEASGVLE